MDEQQAVVNPLINKRVEVKLLPHKSGLFDSTKAHAMSDGMAQNATITYVCPMEPSTETFKKILTDEEQDFLEKALGLAPGEMNPRNMNMGKNFWAGDDAVVLLNKYSNFLDLSDPLDFIKYKILLACKNHICPSMKEFNDSPKESYMFVLIDENEEVDRMKSTMDLKHDTYKAFWKVEDDADTLRFLIESVDHTTLAPTMKLTAMKMRCDSLIQNNTKVFSQLLLDPMLETKVLIRKAAELNVLNRKGTYYYLNDVPLCAANEEPTLSVAAKYLNLPKNQDLLFKIQEQVKSKK